MKSHFTFLKPLRDTALPYIYAELPSRTYITFVVRLFPVYSFIKPLRELKSKTKQDEGRLRIELPFRTLFIHHFSYKTFSYVLEHRT